MDAVLHSLARRLPTGCPVALVVAHPDDEVIAAGASLHLLTNLLLVHVTDGAPRGLNDAARAGFSSPEAYAAARRAELSQALRVARCAATRIGLAIPDQDASKNMPGIARSLAGLFAQHGTQVVITHAYEGGHPDHDATALAVHAAAGRVSGGVIEFPGYYAAPDGSLVTGEFLPGPYAEGIEQPDEVANPARHCEERSGAATGGSQSSRAGPSELTPQERLAMTESLQRTTVNIVLNEEEQALKRAMLDCFVTQARMLASFGTATERFRPARPDFRAPPHSGTLNYEHWGWGMTGPRWRALAAAALAELEAPCAA